MKIRVGLTDKMVLIGLGIAGVYWILDTVLSLFGSYEFSFGSQLLGVEYDNIWPRLIVICLFVIFGSHAQLSAQRVLMLHATRRHQVTVARHDGQVHGLALAAVGQRKEELLLRLGHRVRIGGRWP